MDHLFKALDEHIAHQEWLLKCERNAKEALEKEAEALRAENRRLGILVQEIEKDKPVQGADKHES